MQEKFKELSKTFKLGGIIINNIYEKLNILSDAAKYDVACINSTNVVLRILDDKNN